MTNSIFKYLYLYIGAIFCYASVTSCTCTQSGDVHDKLEEAETSVSAISASDTDSGNQEDSGNQDCIDERARLAFCKIPDHVKVSETAKPLMTTDLYNALAAAWDVPRWLDGEIGNEEFLWYFVTGNGGSSVGKAVHVETVSSQKERCTLELKYTEVWEDGEPLRELSAIPLEMAYENGEWLLDDFGDGTKSQCKSYIRKEVEDFLSGKTLQYMKDNQSGNWYTEEHISKVIKDFEKYISEYNEYLVSEGIPVSRP